MRFFKHTANMGQSQVNMMNRMKACGRWF